MYDYVYVYASMLRNGNKCVHILYLYVRMNVCDEVCNSICTHVYAYIRK